MKATQARPTIAQICPDFQKWPRRWMGLDEDVPYGEGILKVYGPFLQHLIDSGASRKTIRSHCTNLWLLGGEIIRQVSTFEEYAVEPRMKVMESVDSEGGLWCRHLATPNEIRSYEATCRKLHEFLMSRSTGTANQSPQRNAGAGPATSDEASPSHRASSSEKTAGAQPRRG